MDALFKALNDATRRALLDALSQKDGQSLQDLEQAADMTRFGVMKHLKVLEEAGLVVPVKKGRFKYHYLNAVPLQQVIDRWIDPLLAKPAARAVLDLKAKLEGSAPMQDTTSAKPDFVSQTYIKCSQDALWDALRDPDAVPHFHFMAERAERTGQTMTYFVPGGHKMLEMENTLEVPKSRIEMRFQPHWAPDMAPSQAVYLIEVEGDHCKLTIEHYNVPAGQEGVGDGWARMVSGLKTWLETGQSARFGGMQG